MHENVIRINVVFSVGIALPLSQEACLTIALVALHTRVDSDLALSTMTPTSSWRAMKRVEFLSEFKIKKLLVALEPAASLSSIRQEEQSSESVEGTAQSLRSAS